MPRRPLPILRVIALGPATWLDLARAAWELAWSRRRIGRDSGADLIRHGQRDVGSLRLPAAEAEALVERVAYAVPRVAPHLPWRADCWVQALAAQAWLARFGVATEVYIGVQQGSEGFKAHAWLRRGERIITGGEVGGYVPLVTPGTSVT